MHIFSNRVKLDLSDSSNHYVRRDNYLHFKLPPPQQASYEFFCAHFEFNLHNLAKFRFQKKKKKKQSINDSVRKMKRFFSGRPKNFRLPIGRKSKEKAAKILRITRVRGTRYGGLDDPPPIQRRRKI